MDLRKVLGEDVLVFDGAMGTMLMAHGMKFDECSAVYNITHSELVQSIHEAYLKAGAKILKTNTFRANRYALEGTGYTPDELIAKAIGIAKKAIENTGAKAYIALDIGMSGRAINGEKGVGKEALYEAFKEQVEAGVKAGCDLILCETFLDLEELKIAIDAVRSCSTHPLFCAMSFDEHGRTYYGTTLEDMVATLETVGVDALGMNCSVDPVHLEAQVKTLLALTRKPVLIMPNAGMPREQDGEMQYPVGPSAFATQMVGFIKQGVTVVGGCCGTTPEYIKCIVKNIRGN